MPPTALTPRVTLRRVLPTPGGPSRRTFSARSTKLGPASSRTCLPSIEGPEVSNWFRLLIRGSRQLEAPLSRTGAGRVPRPPGRG
jgi:hypothetical protein